MAEISVGSAVGAGFGLIARRPFSVLTWGLLRVGFVLAVLALCAPMLFGMVSDIAHDAQLSPDNQPPPAEVMKMMSHMFALQGVIFLAQIVGLVLSSMTFCAVTRSIVHPQQRAFASLRLGAPELYLVILHFGLGFAFAFCLMIGVMPFVIAVALLAANHQYVVAAIVGGIAVLVLVLGGIYVTARLAFVVPMMVDDGKFHLFDDWALTKGRVGSIVLTGVCLLLIAMVVGLVIDIVFVGLGAAALALAAGGLDNLPNYFTQTPPQQIVVTLAPSLVLLALLIVPIQGGAVAIFFAPWAKAYRDVVPAPDTAPTPASAPPEALAAVP
jgi:hypothetical protein